MKLINRLRDRTLLSKPGRRRYGDWTEWQVCEGTEGLTREECALLIFEWSNIDSPPVKLDSNTYRVKDNYSVEEYRIVEDNFDVASYNAALKG